MKEQDALDFAHGKLKEHNLNDGWEVQIRPDRLMKSATCLGVTLHRKGGGGIIILRQRDVIGLPEEDVKETILHEIAHALTPKHSHDEVWAITAKSLGCTDVLGHMKLKSARKLYEIVRKELKLK